MKKTLITIALATMSTIAVAQTYVPPPVIIPPSNSYRPLVDDLNRKKELNRLQDEQRTYQRRMDDDKFRSDLYKSRNDYYNSKRDEPSVFDPPKLYFNKD